MHTEKFNPVIPEINDGFALDKASNDYHQKLKIIHQYLQLFSSTMKRKYDYLVYVDMQSGSGLKELDNGQVTSGSSAAALIYREHFAKYIFCSETLRESTRVESQSQYALSREQHRVFSRENPDEIVEKLSYYIPESNQKHQVATLCLLDLDGFSMSFDSIRLLVLRLGFICLSPSGWKWSMMNLKCCPTCNESLSMRS